MKQVLVGMSGGVDSTYAALSLRDEGYAVRAAVLKMHEYTDVTAAIESAEALGVPISVIDCTERFRENVVTDFVKEYTAGRTPNPCVVCNERVKFRGLYEEAERLGIPYIATGHYAKIKQIGDRYALYRAEDHTKDQSYMLYRLPAEILSMLILPLGEKQKKSIVEEASARSLRAAERKESQDICFVQGESYAAYIERIHGKSEEGDFVDEQGRVLGRHKGILHYTVGQRKGLGVSFTGRLFIKHIDPVSRNIVLSDSKAVSESFLLSSPVYSSESEEEILASSEPLCVKLRYSAPLIPASVVREKGALRVILPMGGVSVAPGQSAVFYRGDRLVFGGVVQE